jgi:hypothetical protein
MKTTKRFLALALAVMTMLSLTIPVSAAVWKQDNTGWWYQEDNGSYPANTWKWIDGNNDGVAECYYFDGNGYMLSNTTTPDGYTVDSSGAWTVNGVVQTQATGSTGNAGHSANYDPAHPLAGKIDAWNLRLTSGYRDIVNNPYIVDNNIHAMLTNQMEYYRNDLGVAQNLEQDIYNWFCNWLNSMDFRNMSEYQRAQEIKKVIESAEYESGTGTESIYAILINKKGQCTDFAMTAKSLATALGLKCDVKGNGDHSWYYIYADGNRYVGSNNGIDLVNTISDEAFHSGYYDYDQRNDFYNRLNDFYNNQ